MTTKISDTAPLTGRLALFLADYVKWLRGCGATCTRTEKNVSRIAAAYNCRADLTLLPRHATIVVSGSDQCHADAASTVVVALKRCAINFDLNSRLSALSWKISDDRPSLASARHQFDHIVSRRYPVEWTTLLLVSLANASFCRLFGGDAVAMAVVFISTLVGFSLKVMLLRRKIDQRLVFFICAMLSSVLAAGAVLFSLGSTPAVALATSVLYLIPGVPYINSASDMIARHYLCAFAEFIDALILTACLSLGLCAGLMILNLKLI